MYECFYPFIEERVFKNWNELVTEVDGLKHSFQGRCHRPFVKELHPPDSTTAEAVASQTPVLAFPSQLYLWMFKVAWDMILGCFFCWSLASILYYHPYGILAYFYYQPSSSSWASYMHIHCPLDISNQMSTGILNVLPLLSSSSAHITFSYPLFTFQKMIPHSTQLPRPKTQFSHSPHINAWA